MVEYPLSLDDLPDDDDWCDQCGAELPLDPLYGRRRFCSIACQRDWHKEQEQREREAERAGRTCDQCGGAIDPRLRDGTRFCSRRCLYRWHNERDQRELRERRAGRPCWECGKPIPAELQVNVRYCSERCRKHVRAREMREKRARERSRRSG
jgi:endogenous inhibitor of DNA gyrase (YacG/DUF329 family)